MEKANNREIKRKKGQFWTPEWIALAMAEYVLYNQPDVVFEPGVGAGAFFSAIKKRCVVVDANPKLMGCELYPEVLEEAKENGLSDEDLDKVVIGDFITLNFEGGFPAIISNPPYIRHHLLGKEYKEILSKLTKEITGLSLDKRAGFHIYFLIKSLSLLEEGGRLSFIVPADTVEGVFSEKLWKWISCNFKIHSVIIFDGVTPFPGVDTNPIILNIEKTKPEKMIIWVRCLKEKTKDLLTGMSQSFDLTKGQWNDLDINKRELKEILKVGLSRSKINLGEHVKLIDFAKVIRGIATGANDFFFLTKNDIEMLGIPLQFFVRAIGRTRDVPDKTITYDLLNELDEKGRPTYLLSLDDGPTVKFPISLQDYLMEGVERGLPDRALLQTRKKWYKMETRERAPEFFFAYTGRRSTRFIRNYTDSVPLSGFLCVYPKISDEAFIDSLAKALADPRTRSYLKLVGKSYGGGAIKVEPRNLEKLPITRKVASASGLIRWWPQKLM